MTTRVVILNAGSSPIVVTPTHNNIAGFGCQKLEPNTFREYYVYNTQSLIIEEYKEPETTTGE